MARILDSFDYSYDDPDPDPDPDYEYDEDESDWYEDYDMACYPTWKDRLMLFVWRWKHVFWHHVKMIVSKHYREHYDDIPF